ncbi:MAG: ATP-dependent DNA helicase, partial [Halanaerobiales bacterium]
SNNTSNNQESAKNNNNGVQSNKENVKLNLNDIIEELLNQYFHVVSFMRIMEIYNENFIVYYQQMEDEYHNISRIISNENSSKVSSGKSDGKSSDNAPGRDSGSGVLPSNFMVKLFCLDPQQQLQEVLKKGKAAVFFSATLTPLTYHREILGGNEDDYILDLESPFDSNNLCLMIAPTISTKYSNRKKSYSVIADLVAATISSKKGNYLVFFPSYAYMTAVYDYFVTNHPDFDTIIQSRDMTERERGTFLRKFSANKAITGFAVLGGIFSEGVDLKGDRLLGSIVVGVAHPRICLERNLIRDYFQKKNGAGYEFAYLYPGINKVLQAAGRTIRTETDRGLILLIGERFTTARYQVMLPGWWNEIKIIVPTVSEIKNQLEQFWI